MNCTSILCHPAQAILWDEKPVQQAKPLNCGPRKHNWTDETHLIIPMHPELQFIWLLRKFFNYHHKNLRSTWKQSYLGRCITFQKLHFNIIISTSKCYFCVFHHQFVNARQAVQLIEMVLMCIPCHLIKNLYQFKVIQFGENESNSNRNQQ